MKRLPIEAAKQVAAAFNQDQVILVTFDAKDGLTHVVTYGKTLEACKQAAIGGNKVKRALGFPGELCNVLPARAKRKS